MRTRWRWRVVLCLAFAVPAPAGAVEFPNQDPIFHNVFSVSGENRFDLLPRRPVEWQNTSEAR